MTDDSGPAFASYPSLKGKTVFVTGGASGIGAEIVELKRQTNLHAEVLGSETSTREIDEPRGALLRHQRHGITEEHRGNTGTRQQPFDRRTDGFDVTDVARQDRNPHGLNRPFEVAWTHKAETLRTAHASKPTVCGRMAQDDGHGSRFLGSI